ncbi:MAG: T9SS type A sorting domain-containing protein [Bacteroidetes bacterium]|nr:T9SS type A sorting domain-containing protein [Bacteroidota bacterium]
MRKNIITSLITLLLVATSVAQTYNMSNTTVTTCSGTFYDSGGAAGNYSNSQNLTMTFSSGSSARVSVSFNSFATETNNDFLWVYDGPSTAYPLIATYSGSTSPGTITSTGSSLTFRFTSDGSTVTTGWDATISCTGTAITAYPLTAGTVTACSGTVFDNGGPNANYGSSIIGTTQTFCSGTTDRLQFTFLRPYSTLGTGDTLFIYDGSSTAAPLLFIHIAGSSFEDFISSGTCVTFRFKSDATNTTAGWAGQFQCTSASPTAPVFSMSAGTRFVCSGTFYDTGGPSGSYLNSENRSQTFTSYNGERISVNFSLFATESNNDFLWVYDGPSTAYPLIATFTGSNNPGVITSTGTSLTFRFTSDGSVTTSGWTASFSCAGPVLTEYPLTTGTVTTCGGVFYDNSGALNNYPNNENRVMTFTSANGQYLKFDFNPNHFNIAAGDSLFVYDGNSTASPLYAVLTGNISPGSIVSNTSSFTFRFVSNATTNNIGWQALISCVAAPDLNPQISMTAGIRYTCGGNFYDQGGVSGNYPNNENRTMSFYSNSGCGIRFTFNSFSLASGDILYVHDGPSIAAPIIATLTGSTLPAPVQSTGNVLTFRFTSNSSTVTTGWNATISCPNQPLATITANGPLSFCPGGNVTLTAAPNSTYLWSNGANTQSITVNTSGTYWVTVNNANNCTATSNIITVNANASITGNIAATGPLTFCQGGSVTLTASGGSSYVWSNSATGSTLNVTQSGNYYAVVSSGTCVDTTSVIAVTVNPLPVVTLTLMQDSFCTNQPSASVLSGGSPAGGVWSGPGVSGNLFTPSVAGPGLHTIAYTYTDTNACSNVATEVVFVDICNGVSTINTGEFAVYPNPAHDMVIISLGEEHEVKTISLYDMTGRLLLREAVNNRTQVQLSLNGLENGVYLIRAGNHLVKLVKE